MINVAFKTNTKGTILHLTIDSTGLEVYGRRTWKVTSIALLGNC
ncbi:hypothetical protein BTN50_1564 [Candidatus Enterovibrio altilux]|uniref:Mobile element protein n=1 Tax=Candidatus Enterovibrio altilux TaxID=1927128 RepID=A0A291BAL9_9GAMM|nr:hypothetical protein BTN50_1564 [Candidatus Enterovibrio luxaltus]